MVELKAELNDWHVENGKVLKRWPRMIARRGDVAMGKGKNPKQSPKRFEAGTHGGCEASLFEFSEKPSSERHVVRIAALKLDEALACLRRHEPGFEIDSVHNLGIILMASGSPVD